MGLIGDLIDFIGDAIDDISDDNPSKSVEDYYVEAYNAEDYPKALTIVDAIDAPFDKVGQILASVGINNFSSNAYLDGTIPSEAHCDANLKRASCHRAIALQLYNQAQSIYEQLSEEEKADSSCEKIREVNSILEDSDRHDEIALSFCEDVIKTDCPNDELRGQIFQFMAEICSSDSLKRQCDCLRYTIAAMGSYSLKADMKNVFENTYEKIINTFNETYDELNKYYHGKLDNDDKELLESLSIEEVEELISNVKSKLFSHQIYAERQFIYMVNDINDVAGFIDDSANIRWIFKLSSYPKELTFPDNHPQANTLYMVHPVKEGYYLPYEKAEQTIFHEKVNEFIRLSQCLGATKISFRWKHGEQIEGCFDNTLNAQLSGGKKHIAQASAQYSDTTQETFVNRKHEGIAKQLIFDPMQKPYVPEDVLWLNSDTSWQTFVKQRMEGNALHYTIQISSSESSSCSASRKQSIKASFENLIANVDVNFNTAQDSTFKNDYDTVWELDVDFRSLKEFENTRDTSATQLNAIEQAFVDEIQFCLEDANISDTDRKYLERKRVKLGLSPERAEELINTCAPSLSSEEQEYLDTFHELMDDVNDISPKMRKMLDREADSLGISEKRKMELEKMQLTCLSMIKGSCYNLSKKVERHIKDL